MSDKQLSPPEHVGFTASILLWRNNKANMPPYKYGKNR